MIVIKYLLFAYHNIDYCFVTALLEIWPHSPSTRRPRSNQILVAPKHIPILDWLKIDQS